MLWTWFGRAEYQPPRFAGEDGAPQTSAGATGQRIVSLKTQWDGATLTKGAGTPGPETSAWPGFRGPQRDNIISTDVPLARSWPESGPREIWRINLGQGYAAASVRAGRIYIFDYDETEKRDAIRCLSLADAAEIWRYSYPQDLKRNHGISRTVSAVDDRFLVALSPACLVTCLDAETGRFLWRFDFPKQFGTKVPGWYAGQCPLIDGGRAILAPAGPEVLLMAVDCASGEIVWTTPNPHGSAMTHSSVMPMRLDGRDLYIYCGTQGAVGVDRETGEIVWETREFKWHTIAPSPLPLPENRILFTAGYGAKALLAKLAREDDAWHVEPIQRFTTRELGAEQHTPILHDNHVYAVVPKPRQELVCYDSNLNERWASGKRFGLGPFLIADGLIYLLDDHGTLTLADATPERYAELAEAKVLPGPDSWGPLTLVDGRLILRDLYRMICLDVSRDGVKP